MHILKVFLSENKINIKLVKIKTPKRNVNTKVVCTLIDSSIYCYCFYQEKDSSVIECLITKIQKDNFEVDEKERIVYDDVVKDVLMKN